MKVKVTRGRTPGEANCADCEFFSDGCTRERARLHVRATGHTVHFTVRDVTTYGPEVPE